MFIIMKILLCGPSAKSLSNMAGGWSIHWQGAHDDSEFLFGTTVFNGIRAYLEAIGSKTNLVYEEGATFNSVTTIQASCKF